MKVGIIGSGQIARVHGRELLKQLDSRIIGIADKDLARARALAADLQAGAFYQDAKVMIEEQKPDIVHIATPPQTHAELSILSMNYGCHVLVEKPMALTMADAIKMTTVANQNHVRLCVNHNMVFENVFQRAVELVSKGIIGEIVSIEACILYNARRNPAFTKEGAEYSHWVYRLNGGILQDLFPHPASLLMEFISDIEAVQCTGSNRGMVPRSWQDEIRVLINSRDIIGYISVSLNEWPDTVALIIKGKRGTIRADLFSNILTYQKKTDLPRAVERGLSGFHLTYQYLKGSLENAYKVATGRLDKSNGIGHVIRKFHEAIQNGSEPPTSLDKSLRVVELISKIWPEPVVASKKEGLLPRSPTTKHGSPTTLVTGASGFIGTHLIKKLLSENINIRALVRPNSINAGRMKQFDVETMEGDLSDADALDVATKGIKTIYHVGAAMTQSWEENYQTTIKGTEYLIKAALAHDIERFVHVSTVAVYELLGVQRNTRIQEDTPYLKNPKWIGPYAYSKIEAEKLILEAYRSAKLPATVLRLGMVIGPLGRVFYPHFGYRYQDKIFFIIGQGNMILPLTYVENTVEGIYKAGVEKNAIGQAYNIVDDAEISVRGYLESFINLTGIHASIIKLPYIIPYLASATYEFGVALNLLTRGLTSRAQLKWKQAPVRFGNGKAKKELGWAPKIGMEEGLSRTFKWYASLER